MAEVYLTTRELAERYPLEGYEQPNLIGAWYRYMERSRTMYRFRPGGDVSFRMTTVGTNKYFAIRVYLLPAVAYWVLNDGDRFARRVRDEFEAELMPYAERYTPPPITDQLTAATPPRCPTRGT